MTETVTLEDDASDVGKKREQVKVQGRSTHYIKKYSNKEADSLIIFNEEGYIDHGGIGRVYLAHAIDPRTNELVTDKPLAVKILLKEDFELNPKELVYFNRYNRAVKQVECGSKVYLIMEYLPGENLLDPKSRMAEDLEDLSLTAKAALMLQIVMQLYRLHSPYGPENTYLSHGDLKGQNIKVVVDPKSGHCVIYLYDFGFSMELSSSDESITVSKCVGTPSIMSPEAFQKKVTLKNDIYSLLAIFLLILGAENPFYFKHRSVPGSAGASRFDFMKLFKDSGIPDGPIDIKPFVFAFFKRMEMPQAKRPNTGELFSFAKAFYSFCKTLEMSFDAEQEKIEKLSESASKLALLAKATWNVALSNAVDQTTSVKSDEERPKEHAQASSNAVTKVPDVSNCSAQMQAGTEEQKLDEKSALPPAASEPALTFEYHDFSQTPVLNKLILIFQRYKVLDVETAGRLGQMGFVKISERPEHSNAALQSLYSAIQKLHARGLLTGPLLKKLATHLEMCEIILKSPSIRMASLYITKQISENEVKHYIRKLSLQDKLEYFKYLLSAKQELENFFGKTGYQSIYTAIINSLKVEIGAYYLRLKSRNDSTWAGIYFWRTYTLKKEMDMYLSLKTALDSGDLTNFNQNNPFAIDVLKKGIMPSVFRKCLEECLTMNAPQNEVSDISLTASSK